MRRKKVRCFPWNHNWKQWIKASIFDNYANVVCLRCGKHKVKRVRAAYER